MNLPLGDGRRKAISQFLALKRRLLLLTTSQCYLLKVFNKIPPYAVSNIMEGVHSTAVCSPCQIEFHFMYVNNINSIQCRLSVSGSVYIDEIYLPEFLTSFANLLLTHNNTTDEDTNNVKKFCQIFFSHLLKPYSYINIKHAQKRKWSMI